MYDLVIIGGGTSGCACAYIAGKQGLKTLLVEKSVHLGGSITSGLVLPAMKTEDKSINTEFFNDFVEELNKMGGQITYSDGNKGWFNPELSKIVLDKMLTENNVDILFDTYLKDAKYENNHVNKLELSHSGLSLYIEAKYFIDATGDANLLKILNHQMISENRLQSLTLRFLISNVNLKVFSEWLLELDKDRNVTTSAVIDNKIHLSTACTWDSDKNWALRPLFDKAIKDGIIKNTDSAYFQLFTVAGMDNTVALNCPRIISDKELNPLDAVDYSHALIEGRKILYRLYLFCKNYLKGFENSFISNIADSLGVRTTRLPKGKYVYSKEDIISSKHFDNVALASNYPIDIHSDKQSKSKLEFTDNVFEFPVESLISNEFDNLFFIGKCISAEFEAQAALRIQPSCFSMGEAIAKYIAKL